MIKISYMMEMMDDNKYERTILVGMLLVPHKNTMY